MNESYSTRSRIEKGGLCVVLKASKEIKRSRLSNMAVALRDIEPGEKDLKVDKDVDLVEALLK